MTAEAVAIWRAPDRLWYWRFRSGTAAGDDVELRSSRGYLSWDEAADAATIAYPGVRLNPPYPPESTTRRTVGRLRTGCLVILAGMVAVLLVRWLLPCQTYVGARRTTVRQVAGTRRGSHRPRG